MIHYKRIIAAVAMAAVITPNAFADEGNDGGVVSAFKPDQASQSFTSFRKVSRDMSWVENFLLTKRFAILII